MPLQELQGQFRGSCLVNRYGELRYLLDSMWVFPHAVLWDLQLQFLSTQAGKQPTGVLIHSYC